MCAPLRPNASCIRVHFERHVRVHLVAHSHPSFLSGTEQSRPSKPSTYQSC